VPNADPSMRATAHGPATRTTATDDQQEPRSTVLLVDESGSAGLALAPPQSQHWQGRQSRGGAHLRLVRRHGDRGGLRGLRVQSQRRTAGRPGKLDLVPPSAGGGDRRQKRKLGSTPERRRRARAPLVRGHLENREPRHAHVASSPPSPLLPLHCRFDTNGTPLTHELAPRRLLPIELRQSPEIGGGSELAEPVQTETRAARLKLGRPLVATGLRA
jgi:hypothetical protein